jgi:hypothetical protein
MTRWIRDAFRAAPPQAHLVAPNCSRCCASCKCRAVLQHVEGLQRDVLCCNLLLLLRQLLLLLLLRQLLFQLPPLLCCCCCASCCSSCRVCRCCCADCSSAAETRAASCLTSASACKCSPPPYPIRALTYLLFARFHPSSDSSTIGTPLEALSSGKSADAMATCFRLRSSAAASFSARSAMAFHRVSSTASSLSCLRSPADPTLSSR